MKSIDLLALFAVLVTFASLAACRTAETVSAAKDDATLPSQLTCPNGSTGVTLKLRFGGDLEHDAAFTAQLSKGLLVSELMYGFADDDGNNYLRVFSSGDGLVSVAERGTLKIIITQTSPTTTTAVHTAIDGIATSYGPCAKR